MCWPYVKRTPLGAFINDTKGVCTGRDLEGAPLSDAERIFLAASLARRKMLMSHPFPLPHDPVRDAQER